MADILTRVLYIYRLTGEITEKGPNDWIATCKEWGITAHGKSRSEADLRLEYATNLLAHTFADFAKLEDEFKRVGIEYSRYEHPESDFEPDRLPDWRPPPPKYTANDLEFSKKVEFDRSNTILVGQ